MKRTALLALAVGFLMIAPVITSTKSLTDDQAKVYGPGFHEPSADWYDPSYKHRVKITELNDVIRDTGFTKTAVNFGDYFSTADGIIDLASMQLVKVGANQSSIPVTFQARTDAVDFWNPPTLPFIKDEIIGAVIADNGSAIGTIYNTVEGTGYINISVRFSTLLTSKIDKLKFQMVYVPEKEFGVTANDYLSIYAGVPGNWSEPVRVYRDQLPDETAWTNYITIDLPGGGMSGEVWIDMSAPTLYGATSKFFSIDYSFLDGDGFRTVEHYLPGSIGKVTQRNYYPRVQVLEKETPPVVDLYFIADPGNVTYYLYFNHAAESNHRVINNVAVPFYGELNIPQAFFNSFLSKGSVFIDKNGKKIEGAANVSEGSSSTKDIRGSLFNLGMTADDLGYKVSNTFGTVFSTANFTNGTSSIIYTMYAGADFLDVEISETSPAGADNQFTSAYSTHPYDNFAYNNGAFLVDSGMNGTQGSSKFAGFFNDNNDSYAVVASDKSMNYTITYRSDLNYSVSFPVGPGKTRFVIALGKSADSANSTAVRSNGNTTAALLGNRVSTPITPVVSASIDQFADIEIHDITPAFNLGIAYYGDKILTALFGNNLQSMTVNIDNKTGEIPINGTYTINAADMAKLNIGLFTRYFTIKVTGRNGFGQNATVAVKTYIASDWLDGIWTILVMFFSPIISFFGLVIIGGTSAVLAKTRRNAKKNNCIGDQCNV